MKHLPKHLQPRYRYLAVGVESWPDADLGRREFQAAVWDASRGLVGDAGSASTDPTALRMSFDDGSGWAIVRVRRGTVSTARAALACIAEIDGWPVGVWVKGISGTVRGCEEKYINERKIATRERNVVYENAVRRATGRGDRVDVRTDGAFAGATDLDLD